MIVALGLVAAFEIAIGFVPLFGGPGYESSLATGVFVPSVVAVATAFGLAREKREPFDAFCRAVANGALAVVLALVVSLLHGVRVGPLRRPRGARELRARPDARSVVGRGLGLDRLRDRRLDFESVAEALRALRPRSRWAARHDLVQRRALLRKPDDLRLRSVRGLLLRARSTTPSSIYRGSSATARGRPPRCSRSSSWRFTSFTTSAAASATSRLVARAFS